MYSFNTIMQLINIKDPSKNGFKQIKIFQKKLLKTFIFCPIAKNPDLSKRAKMQQKLIVWNFTNLCDITKKNWFALHVLFFLNLLDG